MVNPAFSLQAVERQAPVITVVMKKMVRILGEHCQTGLPLDVQTMYHCATVYTTYPTYDAVVPKEG